MMSQNAVAEAQQQQDSPPQQQQQQPQQQSQPQEQQPQPQEQQHQPQPQQQPIIIPPRDATINWYSSVACCLRTRSDLDRGLIGNYLSIFASLSREDKEGHGEIILELAEEPSVLSLQSFLKSAVQNHH